MSTDETELTFIRCPGCRSLVPAIATRCRMCGHQFDASEEEPSSESSDEGRQQGRVRQRTGFVSAGDDSAALRDAESEGSPSPSRVRELERDPEPVSEPDERESAVHVDEVLSRVSSGEETVAFDADQSEEAELAVAEELEDAEKEQEAVSEKTEEVVLDENGFSDSGVEFKEEEPESKPKRRRRRRKRKPRSAESEPVAEVQEIESEEKITAEGFEEEVTAEDKTGDNTMAEIETFNESVAQPFSGNDTSGPVDSGPSKQSEGTLLGWFVNFALDSKGVGSELRVGQFFVGKQRLRSSDMVIADSSISTPHCLVYANVAKGLKLQDLMSDRGTFIRRKGSKSYVPVKEPTAVEHGDWLRFGDYEVLVCLVPFSDSRG